MNRRIPSVFTTKLSIITSKHKTKVLISGRLIGRHLQRRNILQQTSLSSDPQALYDLREECAVGLGGSELAKEYTATDREKVK